MMKRLILLMSLLVTMICGDLYSQSRAELKNSFYDAESWILFEAYKDALPLYLQLLKTYPDNSNFKFRIGQCYLNTPGEKDKAVGYLEEAVKNINPGYKEGKFRESGAPNDALYYLANAYRINNQLDKALETYALFKRNMDRNVYDSSVVDMQIQSCLNAKELMGRPAFIMKYNLGNVINESSSEFNPVISDDETMIVFSKTEAFYDAILYSVKINGQWSVPQNMNEILKVDRDIFPTSLSSDGKTLYLYSSADYDGIIYSSRFENNTWTPLVKLNDNINTRYWESHATISHDNSKLYFTSNRKGTYGGLDIFVSQKDSTGDWGPSVNLGPIVNSQYNEESPFLSKDDKTLFFSSRGHYNMGGYDIFSSTRLDNGEWSIPKNAGYPLNSTDDDIFYKPSVEPYRGFYSMDSPDGFGKEDIYQVEIYSDDHPRKFIISGTSTVADLLDMYSDSVKISIINGKAPGQPIVVYTNPKTKAYKFNLPQGDYQIDFEGYGAEKLTKNLNLPITYPSDNYVLPVTVLPRTDHTADLYVEGSSNISVSKGDSIPLPLKVEPQSLLSIENWSGGSVVKSEKLLMTASAFNYMVTPRPGENRVIFKLTDRFNNTATADVFIKREKDAFSGTIARPEYGKILTNKQNAAYVALLETRSDEKLLKLITESGVEKKEFSNADNLLLFLKKEALNTNIKPEDVDKLALKVALSDNVLTQSSSDLMANYSEGDLKSILSGTDIYKGNLKTWSDLQRYVSEKSGKKIAPSELDDLAAYILTEVDPAIAVIKDKIRIFSERNESGVGLREAATATDQANPKLRGKWLNLFYEESVKLGLTPGKLSDMFVIISTLPETKIKQFMDDLIKNSEEPLLSSLKSINLRKEKIKTSGDLILFITTSGDKVKYPQESVFKALANLIASRNLPAETIYSQHPAREAGRIWILWVLIGISVMFFFIIFTRREKKKKE